MAVFVVEYDRNLGHPCGREAVTTVKNDIFHLMAAEVPCALLPHSPTQCVDDVGLTATIWANDRGDARIQLDNCPLGKRLKADHFKAF